MRGMTEQQRNEPNQVLLGTSLTRTLNVNFDPPPSPPPRPPPRDEAPFSSPAFASKLIWTRDRLRGHPFQLHFSRRRRMGRRSTYVCADFAIRADERPASRHGAEGRQPPPLPARLGRLGEKFK